MPTSHFKPRKRISSIGRKGREWIAARKAILARYKPIACQYCGARKANGWPIDLHHLVKRSQGGKHNPENLIALCRACHCWAHSDKKNLSKIKNFGINVANGKTYSQEVGEW